MNETIEFNVYIRMILGREYTETFTDLEIDWLFDRIFGRTSGKFQNFSDKIINVDEIEYVEYMEVEDE